MITQLANWGNYPKAQVSEIKNSSATELTRSLINDNIPSIARGNGRCYGDASLAKRVLCSLQFDYVSSFDRQLGIFECESGVLLERVLEIIVPKGWFLPVTPGTKFITIGGAVASDIHGKNHHVDGSFCDHVLEIDLILSNGNVVTCSTVENQELFEATRGGMGLTGFILRVKFRLKKIETSYIKQTQVKASSLSHLLELFHEYKDYTYTMSWIDCLKRGKHFGRSILMAGEHARIDDLSAKQKGKHLIPYSDTLLTLPVTLPSFVLNQYTVKGFNYLYYHKNLKKILNSIVPYDPFFYPLDKILEWNKGYGPNGFLQYQFVLPMEASVQGMTDILHRINKKGMGSFLAVFKVFGKQDSLISFPMEGCTLALDFPVRADLFPFLDELDSIVLDYGGRLYLTKDARMKPEVFWKGYPGSRRFYELVKKYNPEYRFRSMQSDRLRITGDGPTS